MTSLTDQIDRFVRWFFNSSPDTTSIEPHPLAKPHDRRRGDIRRAEHDRQRPKRSHRSTGVDSRGRMSA